MKQPDYSRSAGGAALGARLRRLSEQVDRDATRVYSALGIRFEQRWFGVLNQIVLHGPLPVGEIAERLQITHVSISQAARSLELAGLICRRADATDGRRRLLTLTSAGETLVSSTKKIWAAFDAAAEELNAEAGDVVKLLDRLDDALEQRSLFERIRSRIR